jgi:hypothetical protein
MKRFARLALLLLCLALLACGGGSGLRRLTDYEAYGSAVRWNEFDRAVDYLDPQLRARAPLTDLERERLNQIRVTGYTVKRSDQTSETEMEQLVEIRLISVHTQVERVVLDRQRWRYDPETERWWLMTGLPDFNQR